MSVKDLEGVIKYELVYQQKPFPESVDLGALTAWRTVLHRLRLIGQDPQRYGGLGFGNISQKIVHAPDTKKSQTRFMISGTQTGAVERLNITQFCMVTESSIQQNRIVAEGLIKPSSEALTHAAVYDCDADICCVMHVHSPEIWRATQRLAIPFVGKTIAYGTPEMADAVRNLILSRGNGCIGMFSMLGHEDGIVSYANTAETAGNLLVDALVSAMVL